MYNQLYIIHNVYLRAYNNLGNLTRLYVTKLDMCACACVCEMLEYGKISNEVRLLSAMQLYVPVKYLKNYS